VSFALSLALSTARAQQETHITGRVEDAAEHVAIPTAQVLVSGTTIGANTSDSGTFSFRVPPTARSMTVRRIGYLAQVVPLTPGKTDYTIVLAKDVLRLETQVVTGVATSVASQNAANAVSVVNTQDINQVPAPTMENSLQGKIPGAVIQQNNGGAPGGGLQIQVRGVTSINGNASPLYVVDGIVVNNEVVEAGDNAINQSGGGVNSVGSGSGGANQTAPGNQDNSVNRIADLNPDDIESLEVLKGASASAIYGSKASAGVVIITTKRGASGKAKWTVSQQVGHTSLANEFPIRTFGTLASAEGWQNTVSGASTPAQIAANNAFVSSVYAGPQNLQVQLFSNPQASYQTNINVSGTSGSTQYYASGLSKYDNGTLYNTGYNKQSVRTNLAEQFSSNLTITTNLNYIHNTTRRGITGNDNIGISPYDVFSYTPGFVNLQKKNPDGSWPLNPFGPANPFADAAEINTPQTTSRFIGGGTVNWTPWKTDNQSLQFNATGGADLASQSDLLYAPPDLQVEQRIPSGLPGTSVANNASITYINYGLNLIHHYTGLSWLDATTSVGYNRDRRSSTNPVSEGFNLLAGVNAPTVGTTQLNYFYRSAQLDQSFYGNEQLILLNSRLTINAGVAAERSTNDGDIKKFYYYPHYSASYRVPQFVGFVDEFKLRAAYGQSGNLAPYGARWSPLPYASIAGAGGIASNAILGDPNIKPESEVESELGFDATMFHSRAQFTATVYQKRLSSLLLQNGVAPSYGYSNVYLNGGQFTNRGMEFSLSMTPVQLRNGFTWVSTATVYRNVSVVDKLPAGPFFSGGGGFIAVGRSVTEAVNSNFTNSVGLPIQNGDNSPGILTSLGNEFQWKGFRLYGFLDWSRGGNEQDITDLYFDFGPDLYADTALRARRLAQLAPGLNPWNQPASYLKVRQLTLSYNLPGRLLNTIGGGRLASARLSVNGFNLFHIFHYDGLDPEASYTSAQQIRNANEVTPYPPAKVFYVGLDLGF
jgi:TonB-linked SusC/RagA family outer membrane protein